MKTCPTCDKQWPDEFRLCPADGTSLPSSSPTGDLVDTVIADRYHISKKLGEGGMGSVYLGEHVKMGQKAAIKVIRRNLASDPAAIARFTREARNAAQIKHPNVCTIHDFGETPDGLIYMAMEFIEGDSLADLLHEEGRFSLQRAADVLMQCCDALQAAHDLDIVHRDIKPENIMITKSRDGTDVVKVVDFGIAKAVASESGQTVTQTGFIVGTPDYMSPDQVSGEVLDGRSDIYSLAVVFFRMVTGALPFQTSTPQDALLARLAAEPIKLREALPAAGFSPELQKVLDQALAQRREQRFATAVEFGKAVQRAVGGETAAALAPTVAASAAETRPLQTPEPIQRPPSAAGPSAPPPPVSTPETPQPTPSPAGARRRGPRIAAVVTAIAAVGALVVVWQVTGSDSSAPAAGDTTVVADAGGPAAGDADAAKDDEGPKDDEVTTGTVVISGLPDGGTIVALGREHTSPFELPAGSHDVELRAPGYETKTVTIDVAAGERQTLIYAARRVAAARPPAAVTQARTRPPAAGRTVAVGQTVTGSLSTTDPTDEGRHVQAWSLRASPGQRVDITLRSSDFDAFLYLSGPGLAQPLQNDDGAGNRNSRISTTLAQGGTYTVTATSLSEGRTGGYALSVTAPVSLRALSPGNRRIAVGQSASGRLVGGPTFDGRYVQAWALNADAGAQVDITMRSDDFDPFLYLVGPGLSEPLSNDDGGDGNSARIRTTLARGGTYLVIASQYAAGTTGTYELAVAVQASVRLQTGGRSIAVGQRASGALTGHEQRFEDHTVQAWSLRVAPGTRIDVSLRSTAFDTYLYLVGPGLDDPLADDDGGDGTDSHLSARLAGGEYLVLVGGYSAGATGPYTLSVTAQRGLAEFPTTGRMISLGSAVTGTLSANDPLYEGRHVQILELSAAPGTRVQVSMRSEVFDTYLYLVGPGIAEPLSDDDGGDETNSMLTVTLQRGGTYRIVAAGYDESAVGRYSLAVRAR